MIDFKNIIQGFTNQALEALNLLDENTKKIAEQRLKVCNLCSIREGDFCSKDKEGEVLKEYKDKKVGNKVKGCNCWLPMKTKSSSFCPRNAW